jgi:hypothetical protein
MSSSRLIALALVASTICGSVAASPPATVAISTVDAVAQLGRSLINAIQGFSAAAEVTTIEAQLALVIEQSAANNDIALQALNIAEAIPGISANARAAI